MSKLDNTSLIVVQPLHPSLKPMPSDRSDSAIPSFSPDHRRIFSENNVIHSFLKDTERPNTHTVISEKTEHIPTPELNSEQKVDYVDEFRNRWDFCDFNDIGSESEFGKPGPEEMKMIEAERRRENIKSAQKVLLETEKHYRRDIERSYMFDRSDLALNSEVQDESYFSETVHKPIETGIAENETEENENKHDCGDSCNNGKRKRENGHDVRGVYVKSGLKLHLKRDAMNSKEWFVALNNSTHVS